MYLQNTMRELLSGDYPVKLQISKTIGTSEHFEIIYKIVCNKVHKQYIIKFTMIYCYKTINNSILCLTCS